MERLISTSCEDSFAILFDFLQANKSQLRIYSCLIIQKNKGCVQLFAKAFLEPTQTNWCEDQNVCEMV